MSSGYRSKKVSPINYTPYFIKNQVEIFKPNKRRKQ